MIKSVKNLNKFKSLNIRDKELLKYKGIANQYTDFSWFRKFYKKGKCYIRDIQNGALYGRTKEDIWLIGWLFGDETDFWI